MEIILAILVFIALVIAERIVNFGWDEFWKRTAVRLHIRTATQIAEPDEVQFTSRFATTPGELEDVLRLRHTFFGAEVIVPDDAYRKCWLRNPFSMKIVYYLNAPLGYWALIPIDGGVYQRFLSGGLSHNDMLTEHCKSWTDVQSDQVYLYIIGAVVPPRGDHRDNLNSLLQKLLSARVIFDFYAFAHELLTKVTVQGAYGYPSRTGGYTLLEKTRGFKKSSTLIDGDARQPVFVLNNSDVSEFQIFLQHVINKHAEMIPKWEDADRQKFFASIKTRLKSSHDVLSPEKAT